MAPANPFDMDAWTNPYTPRPPFRHLPAPIARFFGYRPPGSKPQQPHITVVWAFSFLGAFLGVALLEGVYLNFPLLDGHKVPTIIASFGASAILSYNTIEAPLAQPRNLVFGHFLSALVGLCITKLFRLLPYADFNKVRWLAGALSVGVASVVMSITKTVHPPAGATALLCATEVAVTELGWWFLPIMLVGSMLMLVSALIINNVARKYPVYWWTPADLASIRKKDTKDVEKAPEPEKKPDPTAQKPEADKSRGYSASDTDAGSAETRTNGPNQTANANPPAVAIVKAKEHQILIEPHRIVLPNWLEANDWEQEILGILQARLRDNRPSNEST